MVKRALLESCLGLRAFEWKVVSLNIRPQQGSPKPVGPFSKVPNPPQNSTRAADSRVWAPTPSFACICVYNYVYVSQRTGGT